MQDEAALIRRSAAGDQDAFEQLVNLKRDRVYRTAYQVVRNPEDARDVAQLVFVRLWRVIRRYRPGRKFDTWLHRITINIAIDFHRRRPPAASRLGREGMEEGMLAGGSSAAAEAGLASPPRTPDEELAASELRRIYQAVAGELTDRQRLIFTMREAEGMAAEEIARTLGVTASTVRNTLFQARSILRAALRRRFPGYFPGSGSGSQRDPSAPGKGKA